MLGGDLISWLKGDLLNGLKPWGMQVLDFLLPPNCLGCDQQVDQEGQLCLACFRQASFITAPLCLQCGVPLPFGAVIQAGICTVCIAAPPAFTRARAALRYDTLTQRLILPFKHADRTEAARGLALLMARAGAPLLQAADFLVPVPLHRERLRQRRYNQSALLAGELGRIARRPVLRDALVRSHATTVLGPLGFTDRRLELEGKIIAHPHRAPRFAGATVLLIDDVMTSGATANACARALLGAGAAQVNVLTTARVPDPRLE